MSSPFCAASKAQQNPVPVGEFDLGQAHRYGQPGEKRSQCGGRHPVQLTGNGRTESIAVSDEARFRRGGAQIDHSIGIGGLYVPGETSTVELMVYREAG